MKSTLRTLFFQYDNELLEAHLGVLKLAWGVWLLLPFSTFSLSRGAANYLQLAPEWVWGSFFFSLGAVQLFALLHPQRLSLRANISLAAVFLWMMFMVLTLAANPYSTAAPTMGVFIISNLALYLRLKAIKNVLSQRINGVAV